MITKPGIYTDIPTNDYHADPCPAPSFTQSLAKTVIARSPWHAWAQHPRLNPNFERSEATKFDIGNAAHLILTGRGRTLAVFDAADWNASGGGKGAKTELHAQRDAARAAGKLPILRHQYDLAGEMVKSAHLQLIGRYGLTGLFDAGDGEVVLAWQEGGIWLRSMIDWLSADRRLVIDYKTTQASAAPIAVPMKMAADGWCIQAAMHERGLDKLDPDSIGRRQYLYICQECEAPYALSVSRIGKAALTMGRKQLQHATERWTRCMLSEQWDGYEIAGVIEPEYPAHLEARWLERELAEDNQMVTEFV